MPLFLFGETILYWLMADGKSGTEKPLHLLLQFYGATRQRPVAVPISPSDMWAIAIAGGAFTRACLCLRVRAPATSGSARWGQGTRADASRFAGLRRTDGRPMPGAVGVGCSGPHINVGCCEVGCGTRTGQGNGSTFTPPGRHTWWAAPPVSHAKRQFVSEGGARKR